MDINPKIFHAFSKVDEENMKYVPLLVQLLIFEADEPGWYKDTYKNKIKEMSEKLGGQNEN